MLDFFAGFFVALGFAAAAVPLTEGLVKTAVRDGFSAAERTTASTWGDVDTVAFAVRGGRRFASTRPASARRAGICAYGVDAGTKPALTVTSSPAVGV